MLLSKCAMCYTKKLKFIKEQEASGLLRFYFRLLRGLKRFTKKNCKKKEKRKKIQKEFRLENVMKRKGDKLYVKWKGYDSSFNCWIDKKDII